MQDFDPAEIFSDWISMDDTQWIIDDYLFDKWGLSEGGVITYRIEKSYFKRLTIDVKSKAQGVRIRFEFKYCWIGDFEITGLPEPQVNLSFKCCYVYGRFQRMNNLDLWFYNCFSNSTIVVKEINKVVITYKDDIQELIVFRDYLEVLNCDFFSLLDVIVFAISDIKIVSFRSRFFKVSNFNDDFLQSVNPEFERRYLKEKWAFRINLKIEQRDRVPIEKIVVSQAKLESLCLEGRFDGKITIEDCKIDGLRLEKFSNEKETLFFNLRPFRKNEERTLLSISRSNVENVWFDHVFFSEYSSVELFQSRFGNVKFSSCQLPDKIKDFDIFKTPFDKFITSPKNSHIEALKSFRRNFSFGLNKSPRNKFLSESTARIRYETFLELKRAFESNGNFYEAKKINVVAIEALRKINTVSIEDKTTLLFNHLSNRHGLSWGTGVFFTVCASLLFFSFSLWSTEEFEIGLPYRSDISEVMMLYFEFLTPTHRVQFLDAYDPNGWTYFWDFVGRIFVAYGIYQTIQAFRKYRS